MADYLKFALDYWLPRSRYDHKAVRNEWTKGTDIIGFKIVEPGRDDPNDALAVFEAKAQLTGATPNGRECSDRAMSRTSPLQAPYPRI